MDGALRARTILGGRVCFFGGYVASVVSNEPSIGGKFWLRAVNERLFRMAPGVWVSAVGGYLFERTMGLVLGC